MKDLFHMFNSDTTFGEALGYSVFGIAVVFLMLAVLMLVVRLMSSFMKRAKERAEASPEPSDSAAPACAKQAEPVAAGELKLNGVPERTAAMVMALTADKLKKPLDDLLFISIREVK